MVTKNQTEKKGNKTIKCPHTACFIHLHALLLSVAPILRAQATLKSEAKKHEVSELGMSRFQDTWITSNKYYGGILWFDHIYLFVSLSLSLSLSLYIYIYTYIFVFCFTLFTAIIWEITAMHIPLKLQQYSVA